MSFERAVRAEPAVLPDDVDHPRRVDLGRRKRRRPEISGHGVVGHVVDRRRARPVETTVLGSEDSDLVSGRVRDDHVPVRLHNGLTAEAGGETARLNRLAPCEAAVGRRVHEDLSPGAEVVPLLVAVAVMRALRPGIARDPVLVEEPADEGLDWVLPRQPTVRRSAHEDSRGRAERRETHPERERRDHPDVVQRVVSDRRIADPGPRPALVDGRAREHPCRPGPAGVRRRRPADVAGAAAVHEPPRLERGNDRVPVAEGVRLDLGAVLALGIGVRVGADRRRDHAPARCRRRGHEHRRRASRVPPSPPFRLDRIPRRTDRKGV